MVRIVETIMVQCGNDVGSPHAGARIVSQLQACLIHEDKISGALLWIVGSPIESPQAFIPNLTLTKYFLPLRALLQTIRQPVLGVVMGCVDPLATKLLQECDHVMAARSTVFSTDDGHGQIVADEALVAGLVQMVVREKDLCARCDIMTRMLEIHTPGDLGRLKLNFRNGKSKATSGQDTGASMQQQPAYIHRGIRPDPPEPKGQDTGVPMQQPAYVHHGLQLAAAPKHRPPAGLPPAPPLSDQRVPTALPAFLKVQDKTQKHRTASTLFSSSLLPDIEEGEEEDDEAVDVAIDSADSSAQFNELEESD
eukprot:TRINITY_DN64052_c0_g1_i1.p1 TRINITY_DN64052_c0_g1~~TRINITY_DN64052_c0_g1_i1.p1  ORF type:complete len:309 (+),score=61.24 TRINITY_DN64052_c0_g1_i1:133-1059(+)